MQNYKLWYIIDENLVRSIGIFDRSYKELVRLFGDGDLEREDQFSIYDNLLTLGGICNNTILDLQRFANFDSHKNHSELIDLATCLKNIDFKYAEVPLGEAYTKADLEDVLENCSKMIKILKEMIILNDEIK